MEIKKGQRFKCIKTLSNDDYALDLSSEPFYVKGRTYVSEEDGCITNEHGDSRHHWSDLDPETEGSPEEFFVPLRELVLEHGKQYVTRAGDVVTVYLTGDCGKHIYPYNFTDRYGDDHSVTIHGRWSITEETPHDLIKEVPQEAPESKFMPLAKSLAGLLEYKNEKYGNSALNPINVFSGKSKVGQRADDKLSRIQNSDVLRKNDVADLMGYLMLICVENGWDNFDEFRD